MKLEVGDLKFKVQDMPAFENMRKEKGPRLFPSKIQFYSRSIGLNPESIIRCFNIGVAIGTMDANLVEKGFMALREEPRRS